MSWQIFKDNIVKMSDNPDAIPDIDTVAKTYAREYDAAIKRGKDTIEGVSLQKGNVEIMESLFKAALQKGLTSTAPYDLVGEMGKGVLAYWAGATMNNFPTPKTPATGAVSNISTTSNVVISPGQWNPPIVQPALSWPDDPIMDPTQQEAGDDSPVRELEAVEAVLGPPTNDALFDMESRQPKDIKIEEASLIENPEEITIVDTSGITISTEEVIRVEETSSEYTGGERPNQNNNNQNNNNKNWDNGDKEPVRIYSNVGNIPMPTPPGWARYAVEPKRTEYWGGKIAGPNGQIPYEALEKISSQGKLPGYLHPEAAKFFNLLMAQKKKDGVQFSVTSTYRPYSYQVDGWKGSGGTATKKGDGTAATPGYSPHGWAVAIDIGELANAQATWAASQKPKLNRGNPAAAAAIRSTHPVFAWLAKNGPKYGWYNPARLGPGAGVQESWHWEYWGFNTLTKEQRAASGALVAPSGGVIQSTNKQKGSDKSNSTGAYITYNMNLAGPVAFVFSGTPSSTLGAKYMDTLIPDSIKKTKKLVISDWENLKLNKFLTDFPNVKISSISGWSKAGEFIIPNIASYLKSGYFVGLMDPSVTQKFTQKENANLKMIYKPTNWSTSNGIAFGTNLASFGKSMGASAQLTNLGHSAIPAEFFKQFGNRL